MTPNVPFNPEAERLNDLLDVAIQRGAQPSRASDGASEMVALLLRLRESAALATGADDDAMFDRMWEEIMLMHSSTGVRAPAAMFRPAAPACPLPRDAGSTMLGRLHGLLSAALVALMIAGIVGAAWVLRETNSPETPGDEPRHAAIAPYDGSPEASPGATPGTETFWMEYVIAGPQFCQSTVVPVGEMDDLLSEDRQWPERQYTPIAPADEDDAVAAAKAARDYEACGHGAPVTDRYEWELRSPHAPSQSDLTIASNAAGKEISAQYPVQDPAAFIILTHERPGFGIGRSVSAQSIVTVTYVPEHAVRLADGRIAIPPSLLVWADDPNAPVNPDGTVAMRDFYWTSMAILAEEDGVWKVDETVLFCVGHCEEIWGRGLLPSVLVQETPPSTSGQILPSGTPGVTIWIPPTPMPTATPATPER
jgi:hypothetical protein